MKKGRYIISLILNVLIVAAVGFAIANVVFGFLPIDSAKTALLIGTDGSKINYLFEYGVIAAIFGALVALISVISSIVCLAKNKPTSKFVAVIKMLSAGMALAAAVKFFLIDGFAYSFLGARFDVFADVDYAAYRNFLLDWHAPLFISVVAPALIVIDYLFCQLDPKQKFANFLWGFVPGILYFGFAAAYDYLLVAANKGAFPSSYVFYFFNFHSLTKWYYVAIVIGGGIIGIVLATIIVFALRNLVRKIAVKSTTEEPAKKLEDVATKEEMPIDNGEEDKEEKVAVADDGNATVENVTAADSVATPAADTGAKTPSKPSSEPVKNDTSTVSTTKNKPTPKATDNTAAPKKAGKKVVILKTEEDKARAEGIDIRKDYGDEEAEEAAERKAEAKSTYKSVARVYHISKQPSGKWQVKLATGERAIKLFDTQQQAILYAKGLVKTQGGSIRIHAVSGKMRKE